MKESYFMKRYKKRWYYRLMMIALLGLVIIGLIGMGIVTYHKAINNPDIITNNEDYNNAIDNNTYAQISAEQIYDLGIVMTEETSRFGISTGKSATAHFIAIKFDEKMLTISLPNKEYDKIKKVEKGQYILSGKFKKFNEEDLSFLKKSIIKGGIKAEELDKLLLGNYLDYSTPLDISLGYICGAGLILIFILILIPTMRKNITSLKRLKVFSNGNLEMACQEIDSEIELPEVYTNSPITITKNYIIVETQQVIFAMPLRELMWVFKSSVRTKIYGIIPVGKKTNSIEFVFSDKSINKVDIYNGRQRIDEIIEYISNNCPISYVGYSQQLAELFKNNSDEFISTWAQGAMKNK